MRLMTKEVDLKGCHEFIPEPVQRLALDLLCDSLHEGGNPLKIGCSGVVLDDREMQTYERAQRLQKAQRDGEMICVTDPVMGGQKWIKKPKDYDKQRRRSPMRAGRCAAVPRESIWQARPTESRF